MCAPLGLSSLGSANWLASNQNIEMCVIAMYSSHWYMDTFLGTRMSHTCTYISLHCERLSLNESVPGTSQLAHLVLKVLMILMPAQYCNMQKMPLGVWMEMGVYVNMAASVVPLGAAAEA